MKISNREKTLLAILLLMVFGFVFLKYVINPVKAEIIVLNTKSETKAVELKQINKLISQEELYQKAYDSDHKKLIDYSKQYYSNLYQEELLVLLNTLNCGESFLINDFKFSDKQDKDERIQDLNVTFDYTGPYEELYMYIDEISNYDKFIRINDLDIESEIDNIVSGELEINFSSLPLFQAYADGKSIFEIYGDLVDKQTESPYVPYPALAQRIAESTKVSDDELGKIELYLKDRTVKPVIGFDNSKTFFVGSNVDIVADIEKTEKRLYGKDAIKFSYNFGVKRDDSKANLVFEENLIIDEQNKYLSMWVYSNEVTGHQIGAVLVDAIGESYDLVLSNNVDFKEWRILEVEIPIEVNYPCKVQRIYTKSTDYDQRLNGTLIFDQIQTAEIYEDENID